MSREIKVRIWDNAFKKMKYDPSIRIKPDDIIDGILIIWLNNWLNESTPDCEKQDSYQGSVAEQYTGLTDKNGKEIYEGDIVRTTDRVTVKDLIFPIGVVEFKQQAFWICNVPSERPDFTHNETLLQYWETDLEVIGNIHENPELLDKNDKV